MNKGTKLFLSILGVGAIIVPAVLLIIFTTKAKKQPNVPGGPRQIDQNAIEDTFQKYPKPIFTSPIPASSSAKPTQASQSAQ